MRRATAALAALIAAAGCTPGAREAAPYEGVWESVGYGFYLVVEAGSVDVYEHTAVSCVLISSGPARGISDVVTLDDDGTLVLEERGRVLRFDQLDALAERCTEAVDPSDTLAVAAASVEEHHPSLDERDPGWAAHRDAILSRERTDPAAVLHTLQELLAPLADPQLRLATDDETILPGGSWSAVPEPITRREVPNLVEMEGLMWGVMPGGPGYLSFARLGGSGDAEDAERSLAGTLDRALAEVDPPFPLIIDLRALRDGTESAALLVASRFVPRETSVGTRAVRIGDPGEFSEPVPIMVRPMPTGTYPGRIVVIIGPDTAGPGELLALALQQVPGAVFVGEPTAGSPSPILVRSLPNGWSLGVPHQRVWDPEGRLLELNGLVPDVVASGGAALAEALALAGA